MLQVLTRSLRTTWEELLTLAGLSLLWWVGLLLIVGAAPATTALATMSYQAAQGNAISISQAWAVFRRQFWLSWRIGLAALISGGLILFNLWFYAQQENWLRLLAFLFIYLGFAWLTIHLYIFGLLTALKTPSARQAYRNAAILAFSNPLYSLGILLFLAIFTLISLIFPPLAIFVWPGASAMLAGHALLDRLQTARIATE